MEAHLTAGNAEEVAKGVLGARVIPTSAEVIRSYRNFCRILSATDRGGRG